jgi:SAM-dependent methyltransferase
VGECFDVSQPYTCRFCGQHRYITVTENIKDWEYGVDGIYSFVECESCRAVQIHPFPELETLERAYDVDYHGYQEEKHYGLIFRSLHFVKETLLRRNLRRMVRQDARVLDVGCGAAGFLASLRGIGIEKLEGIDFGDRPVELARKKGISVYHGLFVDFPAEPQTYDLIIMNNYIEHTLDPVTELTKARQLLKPGGLLIGEVPGFDSIERRFFGRFWGGNHVPRHTFQFPQKRLRLLLEQCGFDTVRIVHDMNTGHWALSVQNAMQRNKPDLRHNSSLSHGRDWYYFPLLAVFIPINVVCVALRRAGVIKFYAHA